MVNEQEINIVPARQGKAIRLSKGQALKIINVHGHQVVDFWAFNANDPTEFLSMEHLRAGSRKCFATKGDKLLTNRRRPILEFEEDTWGGSHDTLIAACDIYRYQGLGCKEYHDNCTDNLRAATRSLGLNINECPSPLNIWMYFPVDDTGSITWGSPTGIKKNDYVVLRANMDCIAVMSCCPMDIWDIHGEGAKPTNVEYTIL